MSEASEPSVGDLLAAADRDALRLLGDAEPSDGPALAAGWAQVLTAGYDVLAAIPTPTVDQPAATGGDYLSVRVAAMVSHVGSVKPLPLRPHPSTVRIADALRAAAAMVRRHADPAWMGDPVARADAAAARVRVARVLAAVAHVTGRELQGYSRQLPGADPYLPGKPMSARVAAKWVRGDPAAGTPGPGLPQWTPERPCRRTTRRQSRQRPAALRTRRLVGPGEPPHR